jgi:hypothetical protein
MDLTGGRAKKEKKKSEMKMNIPGVKKEIRIRVLRLL